MQLTEYQRYRGGKSAKPKRKKRPVLRFFLLLLLLCLLFAAGTLFFRVKSITFEGMEYYSAEQLAAGFSVKEGDRLLFWHRSKAGAALVGVFPYLTEAEVTRKLNGSVTVLVSEDRPALAVPSENGYAIIGRQGRVLQLTKSVGELCEIAGVSLQNAAEGESLSAREDEAAAITAQILNALVQSDFVEQASYVSLKDTQNVQIICQNRFLLDLGVLGQDDVYRLRFARAVITERLAPSDIGKLYWDSKGQLHFVPDTLAAVMAAKKAVPAQEPTGSTQTPAQDKPAEQNAADKPAETGQNADTKDENAT